MSKQWLYRYEAKGIQEFIFATSKLREIAGASAIVAELENMAKDLLQRVNPTLRVSIAAAGCGEIGFADRSSLEDFASEWPMLVATGCPGLHMVQAWVDLEANGSTEEWVVPASKRDELHARLEAARMAPKATLPEAGPWMARSGRSGLPAIKAKSARTADGLFDMATWAKSLAGKAESSLNQSLLDELKKLGVGTKHERLDFVFDLERLDEAQLAIIHADGDKMGSIFSALAGTPLRIASKVSIALNETTLRSTVEAICKVFQLRANEWSKLDFLPLRPIVLGGDDLTILTLARDAIPFVTAYLEAFERHSGKHFGPAFLDSMPESARDRLSSGLTASAGIAMVSNGYPFHAAYELAEDLCAFAKRPGPEPRPAVSCFAFHRVTTAALCGWDDIYREELSSATEGEEVSLVGGPWIVGRGEALVPERGIQGLQGLAAQIAGRKIPRGPLREWVKLALADPPRATSHWERFREVLSDDPSARRTLLDTLSSLGAQGPWRPNQPGWSKAPSTPIYDALTWAMLSKDTCSLPARGELP